MSFANDLATEKYHMQMHSKAERVEDFISHANNSLLAVKLEKFTRESAVYISRVGRREIHKASEQTNNNITTRQRIQILKLVHACT